ncbi:DinB family protein [Brevibacillus sp. NRS-1366]|uniref:DinB family protein n=1 Tax=Brevibacillus sp. NRS-1366 TaxID=3233899 RepID=UPI003D19AA61
MMKHEALRLYDYHLWANEKVFQRLQEVPKEVCEQEVPSVFPTITKTLHHMLLTDYVWLLAMQGESYEKVGQVVGQFSGETAGKDVEELREKFSELAKKFRDFFRQIDLDATSAYSHPEMGTIHARYSDIVQHVINHGTYHRGNISAMLRQLGHAGVSSDYVYYLFEVLPSEK